MMFPESTGGSGSLAPSVQPIQLGPSPTAASGQRPARAWPTRRSANLAALGLKVSQSPGEPQIQRRRSPLAQKQSPRSPFQSPRVQPPQSAHRSSRSPRKPPSPPQPSLGSKSSPPHSPVIDPYENLPLLSHGSFSNLAAVRLRDGPLPATPPRVRNPLVTLTRTALAAEATEAARAEVQARRRPEELPTGPQLHKLGIHLTARILAYLEPVPELLRVAKVCKSLRKAAQNPRLWRQVQVGANPAMPDSDFVHLLTKSASRRLVAFSGSGLWHVGELALASFLCPARRLAWLDLTDAAGFGPASLAVLAQSTLGLRVLNLSNCHALTDAAPWGETFRNLKALEVLILNGNPQLGLQDYESHGVSSPNLLRLELVGSGVGYSGMGRLVVQFPGLEVLSLAQSPGIDDLTLGLVGSLRFLAHLDVSECSSLSETGLRSLLASVTPTRPLRTLMARGLSCLTPRFLDSLAAAAPLGIVQLDLGGCPELSADRVLAAITGEPDLETLGVSPGSILSTVSEGLIRGPLASLNIVASAPLFSLLQVADWQALRCLAKIQSSRSSPLPWLRLDARFGLRGTPLHVLAATGLPAGGLDPDGSLHASAFVGSSARNHIQELDSARSQASVEMLEFLLALDPAAVRGQANISNPHGVAPIHLAAAAGNAALLQGLVFGAGARANAVTNDGDTALHFAVASGSLSSVVFLVADGGLSPEATNSDGYSPYHLARELGHGHISSYLSVFTSLLLKRAGS